MNARTKHKNWWKHTSKQRRRTSMLRGIEALEARQLLAGELLEVRLDAVHLDGTTPVSQLVEGQEFLLRGRARDLRDPSATDPADQPQGAFQVYTDIAYLASEVEPIVSEVQLITVSGSPTGGSFRLSFNGNFSQPINYLASPGAVQAQAIQEGLETIPALNGNVRVERDRRTGVGEGYFVRFINGLQELDVPTLGRDVSQLQGAGDIQVAEFAKGERSNTQAFRQAFVYNSRTDSVNPSNLSYPDARLGADATNLFDNVGGGARPFEPPGQNFTTYFLLRARAVTGGADDQIEFMADMAGEVDIFVFGRNDPLTNDQVLFTYAGPDADRLTIPVRESAVTVQNDAYIVNEDAPPTVLSPSPLANDSHTGTGSLTITSVSNGSAGGTLEIVNSGANVRYTPFPDYFGQETFSYTATNSDGDFGVGQIVITVRAVNDAPSFTKGPNIIVDEDAGPQLFQNWATNISPGPNESNQQVTFTVTNNNAALFQTPPAVSPNGTLTFRANPNANGVATVTVVARDDGGTANGGVDTSAQQTFTITVRAVNDAPVQTVPGDQSVPGNQPLVFTGATALSVFDVDSGTAAIATTLTVQSGRLFVGGSIHPNMTVTGNQSSTVRLVGTWGQISSALSELTYVANSGFQGNDTLRMVTNDQGNTGSGGPQVATSNVRITVTSPGAPRAVNDTRSMDEDAPPITIDVLANDIARDGAQPTLRSFTQPAAGGWVTRNTNNTPSLADDRLVFTPARDFFGQVQFTYTVSDNSGFGGESVGTVTINVRNINDAPRLNPNVTTELRPINEDNRNSYGTAVWQFLNGVWDPDPNPLRGIAVSGVSTANGSWQYTLNGGASWSPITNATSSQALLLPANGEQSRVRFLPNQDFNGETRINYFAWDQTDGRSPGSRVNISQSSSRGGATAYSVNFRQATLEVLPVNDPPVAQNKSYTTREDVDLYVGAERGLLIGVTDVDGDTEFRAQRFTNASNGTVSVNPDGAFLYRPNQDFFGTDSFQYRVRDLGGAFSAPRTVTITVTPVNDRPVSRADSYATQKNFVLTVDASLGVLANDFDVDGDPLRAVLARNATNGRVQLAADGSFVYTPNRQFVGNDTFEYWAVDNANAANSWSPRTTVTIRVTDRNDPPNAVNKSYTTLEDVNLVVTANNGLLVGATDPDDDVLRAIFVTQPSRGQLIATNANGSFTYRPFPDINGTDSFTYRVTDGLHFSPIRTVTINVTPVNDPPPAVNDNFNVIAGIPDQLLGDVLENDRAAPNPDGPETITMTNFDRSTRQGGTVRQNASGRLLYTPPAGFVGHDTFRYQVTDGNGGFNSATVNLYVQPRTSNTISGFVYRDVNENGRRDGGEAGIANVLIRLIPANNPSAVRNTLTNGSGHYAFNNVAPGTYTIVQVQPNYLIDGAESVGTGGGTIPANDRFVVNVPQAGFPNGIATGYNFGEKGVLVGQPSNGQPALQLTLEEILASNTNKGALLALNGNTQSWFTTLDPTWANVHAMTVQLSNDLSSLTLRVVVNQNGQLTTYQSVIGRTSTPGTSLKFRVMATNNQGFRIIRLDGELKLGEFTRISSTAATDSALASF
jgi:VCBS repeat-containing protein